MRNPNPKKIPNLYLDTPSAAKVWRVKCCHAGLSIYFDRRRRIDPSDGWETTAESMFFVRTMGRYRKIVHSANSGCGIER